MNRRSAILSAIAGWIGFLACRIGLAGHNTVPPRLVEMPQTYDSRQSKTMKAFAGTNVLNSEVNSLISAMRIDGWLLEKMSCHPVFRSRGTKWESCYRTAEIVFWKYVETPLASAASRYQCLIDMRERNKPTFATGCGWCGSECHPRQVPATIPTSDLYCDSKECVIKCEEYYSAIYSLIVMRQPK
jgi:hypothetical protein